LECGFQQGVIAKKFYVLFRQPVATQSLNEGAETESVATRKNDRRTILRDPGIEWFVVHATVAKQFKGHGIRSPEKQKKPARNGTFGFLLIASNTM